MSRLAVAFLASLVLVACSGENAGSFDPPDDGNGGTGGDGFVPPEILPAGVYEYSIELEWPEDPSPFWSAPLPQAVEGRMNAIEPWPDLGVQEINFFLELDHGWGTSPLFFVEPGQVWIPLVADAFTGLFSPNIPVFEARTAAGRCHDVVRLEASEYRFWPVDGDGDGVEEGIEGIVAGTAIQQSPGAGPGGPTRPFRGRLRAVPDRTPPAIVPAPDPVSSWGNWEIRFTEPVFFHESRQTFVLDGAGFSITAEAGIYPVPSDSSHEQACRWDIPLSGLRFFVPPVPGPEPSFPAGATIRFAELRIRDLAGNVLEGEHLDTGLRIADPQGRPTDSFEDGRLDGWITAGDVVPISADDAPEGADGAWLASGSLRDGFAMFARIDVPDTEAPALELVARLSPGAGGWPWYRELAISVATPEFTTHGVTGLSDSGWNPVRIDLTPHRGSSPIVSVVVTPGECHEGQARVLLDGFRVVP